MDIQTIKTDLPLMLGVAERAGAKFKKGGRGYQSRCPIHGGDNPTAFNVWQGSDGVALYHCWTHESQCGKGDIFSLVMKLDNCDFKTALKTLGGDVQKNITPTPPKPTPPKPLTLPSSEWQKDAFDFADKCHAALLSKAGKIGQEYLASRRIFEESDAWYKFQLGYTEVMIFSDKNSGAFTGGAWKRPAFVMPWIHSDKNGDVITQIHYRIIGADKDKLRTNKQAGADVLAYGLPYLTASDLDPLQKNRFEYAHTLAIFEGEFNAISAAICEPRRVAVKSFGAEMSVPYNLRDEALQYERVIVWCDTEKRAAEYDRVIGRKCERFYSQIIDGVKYDANQLFKEGRLHIFLESVLGFECVGFG